MKLIMRKRNLLLWITLVAGAILTWVYDPDGGLSTLFGALALLQLFWGVGLSHLSRKCLFDYPEADMQSLIKTASRSPTGAGLVVLALAYVFVGLLGVFAPRAHAAELPQGFYKYGPMLKAEQTRLWPTHPNAAYLAALVEQESCVSLKSPRCWNPAARLKSAREEGAGMPQLTRAYRKDGSLRFDTLTSLTEKYAAELGELTWSNVYTRPNLQLRALVMMSRDTARAFRTVPPLQALAFGDAAYNGGLAGVQRERRACAATQGCDPNQWFDNVEKHCLKSQQALYGGRSACDINREHVHYVMRVRVKKYQGMI